MLRSVRMTFPPEPASAEVGQAALRERPVTADTGRQGQRDLARILANSALSGGFLDRALELIRASTGADTALILRACDDPLRLAVVAGAGDLHQPRVALVPAVGPLDPARTPAVHGDMNGEQDPVTAVARLPVALAGDDAAYRQRFRHRAARGRSPGTRAVQPADHAVPAPGRGRDSRRGGAAVAG